MLYFCIDNTHIAQSLHAIFSNWLTHVSTDKRNIYSINIIILSVLAVLDSSESWDAIELYSKENLRFLKQILRLPGGIPSHDTIDRMMGMINSRRFEQLFAQLVHAWSVENEICLSQHKVDGKSNEITAIPELLDLVEVDGAIVTIAATGTQRAIA